MRRAVHTQTNQGGADVSHHHERFLKRKTNDASKKQLTDECVTQNMDRTRMQDNKKWMWARGGC